MKIGKIKVMGASMYVNTKRYRICVNENLLFRIIVEKTTFKRNSFIYFICHQMSGGSGVVGGAIAPPDFGRR